MATVVDETPMHWRGNGRPATQEQTLGELVVAGIIPSELDGRYVRTAPNPSSVAN